MYQLRDLVRLQHYREVEMREVNTSLYQGKWAQNTIRPFFLSPVPN